MRRKGKRKRDKLVGMVEKARELRNDLFFVEERCIVAFISKFNLKERK